MTTQLELDVRVPEFGAPALSRRSAAIATMLGVTRDDLRPRGPGGAAAIRLRLTPGSLTVFTGPSGSGKSSVLRAIHESLCAEGVRVIQPPTRIARSQPCSDLVGRSPIEAMRMLASAGLADVRAMVMPLAHLSDGQRSRVMVAMALDAATRQSSDGSLRVVMIDEFGSNLDALSARSLAALVRRAVREIPSLACIVATPRRDIAEWAMADATIALGMGQSIRRSIGSSTRSRRADGFVIQRGIRGDYARMAHLHYRAGDPATIELVIRAVDRTSGECAGVLVISRPTLHAGWREMAWPGRYSAGTSPARRINRELRCISRVIVDPRFRSLGVAERLVRAYLRRPITRATEALAAMGHAGRAGGFFARAGMTAYALPVPRADARAADALDHAGIESWRLADPASVAARVAGSAHARMIERELRVWAHRRAPRVRDGSVADLVRSAARVIGATPMAYAHTAEPGSARRCA